MKRYTQRAFFVAVALAIGLTLFFLISPRIRGSSAASAPVRYRSIDASQTGAVKENTVDDRKITSAIKLNPNEILLDLYTFNLDYDEEEEQILIARCSDDTGNRILIVVADYSPGTRHWVRAWEGDTLATKVKTFQVAVYDMVGDHNLNIVCTGMNDANEQTMTVFWKTTPEGGGQGLAFVKVFETAAGAVLVEDAERPDSYKLGQTNAESWPISVWRSDPGSANFLDQIKETWIWSFFDRSFVKTTEERIPGASIAQKMAAAILDGKAETFSAWLEGIWYKESQDPLSKDALFLTFQPRDGSLLFSGQDVVEIYQWENSNPTRFGLYIAARNQSVRNLRRLMDIELAASDMINVRVFQDLRIKADVSGRWDGRYRRMSAEIAKSFRKTPSSAHFSGQNLDGLYIAPDGSRLKLTGS
ncbi:MAG: pallilysin-related adhesin, partial [Spirochaetales bacterium]